MHPRIICELRDLAEITNNSDHIEEFFQSMKEIYDSVKQTLIDNINKIKKGVNERKKYLQFHARGPFMVHLKKDRL
jgi:hypothetical protein